MSKLSLITYPCHAHDGLSHLIPKETQEQIKALMLEIVKESTSFSDYMPGYIEIKVINKAIKEL